MIPPVSFGRKWCRPRQDREQRAADQHVVQVGDDEVGVVHLQVEGHHRDHHAGDAAGDEDDEEAEHVEHRRAPADPARSTSWR
jgi:hypothetical protein